MAKVPLHELKKKAGEKRKENKKYFQKLRKKRPKNLDVQVQNIHDDVFAHTDCLQCANCCKTISPVFTDNDIARIARVLRMKPSELVSQYLRIDEDEDYVLQSSPCSFLAHDNSCLIYEDRPRACRQYPHTNRKNFHTLLPLTLKNTEVCPAAFEIVENLKKELLL